MKRRIVGLGLLFCAFMLIIYCSVQKPLLYKQAVQVLQETELSSEGSYEVTEELLIALNNADYTQPRNIILMIGDGMGFNIVEAAQTVYGERLYNGTLAMNYMPFRSSQCTYSVSSDTTDSAAGATALATGFKTTNGVIAMDYNAEEPYQTVLELADLKGKSTGVVATKAVTDATPAAFTAHVSTRKAQDEIAKMQLDKVSNGSLDLILGGGRSFYELQENAKAFADAEERGMTYVTEWASLSDISLPVVGLFSEVEMDTLDETMPTVAEMTKLALDLLSDDEDGFFLMVEGSQIDSYGEKNNFERQVKEVYDFDCAVAVAMQYTALNPDTVLIITADHETGDLWIPAEPSIDNINQYQYTTGNHTNKKVPVFAAGYGVEALAGIKENTDIGILLASYLGEENHGQNSTIYTISEQKEVVTFDDKNREFEIPLKAISEIQESGDFVNAVHMIVKNAGDSVLQLPVLVIEAANKEYTVEPQVDYIAPGEELLVGYTIPSECRKNNVFTKIEKLILSMNDGDAEAELEFSAVKLTARPFGK